MSRAMSHRVQAYMGIGVFVIATAFPVAVESKSDSKFYVEVDVTGQPLRNVSGRTVGQLAPYGPTVSVWCSLAGGNKLDAVAFDVYAEGKLSRRALTYGAKPATSIQELCDKHWTKFRR